MTNGQGWSVLGVAIGGVEKLACCIVVISTISEWVTTKVSMINLQNGGLVRSTLNH